MWNWLLRWIGFRRDPARTPDLVAADADSNADEFDAAGFNPSRWERRPRRIVSYTRVVQVESQSEGSAAASDGVTLALVRGSNGPKWLMLRCPCGCGEIRRVSLSLQIPPTWRLRLEPGPLVTLSPSVDLQRECRAHFILSRNRALLF